MVLVAALSGGITAACLEDSYTRDAQQMQSVMGSDNYAIVTESEGYVLRFKLLELWGELMAELDRN